MDPLIPSALIPQANSLERLVELLDHWRHDDVSRGPRQLEQRDRSYYLHAGRLLDLIDCDGLTELGRGALGLNGTTPSYMAARFADSVIGSAWLRWAGGKTVYDLEVGSAREFLLACADLAPSTARRRAATLEAWLRYFRGEEATRGRRPKSVTAVMSMKHESRPAAAMQLSLAQTITPEVIEEVPKERWPDASRFPHNESGQRVRKVVQPDIDRSDEVLIIVGYTSLNQLIELIAQRDHAPHRRLRVLIGHEPYPSSRQTWASRHGKLEDEVRDYWLERNVSLSLCYDLLVAREALALENLEIRIGSSRSKPVHAKIYACDEAVTIGSSNFTHRGLGAQSEGNVRFSTAQSMRMGEAWQLAEGLWENGHCYKDALRDLIDQLLCAVTWQEALARACAVVLEGDWARQYIPPEELAQLNPPLWPHQVQGLGQILWILENVGSVLVADATGSGKTRLGSWAIRGAYDRQMRQGTHRRFRSTPLVLTPPGVTVSWENALLETNLTFRVDSNGPLSNSKSGNHKRLVKTLERTELLAVDEAHNYLNKRSKRTRRLLSHYADQVLLFTATPINKQASDLIALIEILGPDNFSDEALGLFDELERLRARNIDNISEDLLAAIQRELERCMVRRTRTDLNRISDEEPERYMLPTGRRAKYPEHQAKYYEVTATDRDLELADRIGVLSRQLTGVARLGTKLEMPVYMRQWGRTEAQYLNLVLSSTKSLAVHHIFDSLRSSRAALYEHVHGTSEAAEIFLDGDASFKAQQSGDVIGSLRGVAGNPPQWKLEDLEANEDNAPRWSWDAEAHKAQCKLEISIYREIAELTRKMSEERERAKCEHLAQLHRSDQCIIAFDRHVISLAVFRRQLCKDGVETRMFTGHGGRETKKRASRLLAVDSESDNLVALCSDAMSEGLNLQRASCVVHLDTPTVIRTAEQRAGRVDRMDSRHDKVVIWWPRDASGFAPRRRDLLRERHEVVDKLIGSNLELPEFEARMLDETEITPEELASRADITKKSEDIEGLYDAFRPVHEMIGAERPVSAELYREMRSSQADVISCVSVLQSDRSWAFIAVGGVDRRAPRWVFFEEGCEGPTSDFSEVSKKLRERLETSKQIQGVTEQARMTITDFVTQLEEQEHVLLPARRRRALEQARAVLTSYLETAWLSNDEARHQLLSSILKELNPDTAREHLDPRSLAEGWLQLTRPYRDAHMADRSRRVRRWTCHALTDDLKRKPISSEALQKAFDPSGIPTVRPAGERVLAMIVGVTGQTVEMSGLDDETVH
jgi:superfamily II DNA or RNA helicase